MPIDNLPDKLTVPTRATLIERVLRSMKLRAPTAVELGEGTQANNDAAVIVDALLPVYGESVRQADADTLDGKTGAELDTLLSDLGMAPRSPATGASGYLEVSASSGGGAIIGSDSGSGGDEAKNVPTGILYEARVTGTYADGDPCAVVGVTTGPNTDLDAGTVLQWVSPRPGINATATVLAPGLTGGALEESDEEIRTRIRSARANPAAAGNDADYQERARETPGLSVQASFTYPTHSGPGSTCLLFTLTPSQPGGNRIPNNAQIGQVQGWTVGTEAKDDSCTFGPILSESTSLTLHVVWTSGVAKWVDGVQWPPAAGATYPYSIYAVTDALTFEITSADPLFATTNAPQVGQTIGVFDKANVRFLRKRILTATHNIPHGTYEITCDTSNGASDNTFTPAVGDYVSPWSDSLDLLAPSIVDYFDAVGPGEQYASFFDEGFRQKRSPPDPTTYPKALTKRLLIPILQLPAIDDADIVTPSTPHDPTVGTPGVSAYMLVLTTVGIYPE